MPATTTKRRKAAGKQQNRTIDSFFSSQVSVPVQMANDDDRKTVSLNAEQSAILRRVIEGQSVFFTGSAGTGKSLLLRAIIEALKKKFGKSEQVAVTASTGMAASNIGGMTVHAWGGILPTPTTFDLQIRTIKHRITALRRWERAKVLIIDEVSMIDGPLFTRLCQVAQHLRKTQGDSPFGGIQLVVTGDFFQLPPIGKDPMFAFECAEWAQCIPHTLSLSHVFRQKDDDFVGLLNEIRLGNVTPAACATFKGLSRTLPPHPCGILPTELFPRRNEVDLANAARLKCIPADEYVFISKDSGSAAERTRETLLSKMMAPRELVLKVGAQVMLIKNLDEHLINGTVGKVLGFWSPSEVEGDAGTSVKSGPAHIRNIQLQADKTTPIPRNRPTFEDKENVAGYDELHLRTGDTDLQNPKSASRDRDRYPLVEFSTCDGLTTETVLVVRDEFRHDDVKGRALARRKQVPLILAWAISIHKSQGQTLQRVKIDLGKVFETGQSYVALSRAASMAGLQVLSFDPDRVKAHPRVIRWNATLQGHT